MDAPLIGHFLIGAPGSGKSTFAGRLATLGNCQIVSTDTIRYELYGDESIQGDWAAIEGRAVSQIREAIAARRTPIYDATNAKRAWRMALLQELNAGECSPLWVAWQMTAPPATCKARNRQRTRSVPDGVIDSMCQSLQDFPPVPAEGFAAVIPVSAPADISFADIEDKIRSLSRSAVNRANRTLHRKVRLHRYSKLLDFDRLMHLISLTVRYPGIGNLQETAPHLLEEIFGAPAHFESSLDEVRALAGKLCGEIYADAGALAADLRWLEEKGLIGTGTLAPDAPVGDMPVEPVSDFCSATHAYSDLEPFKRLLQTIRFILHRPFLPDSGNGCLPTLVKALADCGAIQGDAVDAVRKDIEKVLKPYKILPEFPLRKGYFAGTGILSRHELKKVFGVLQSQAKSLDEPVALEIYQTFKERMAISKLEVSEVYPVRAIANRSIIDCQLLPASSLARNLEGLENAIETGRLLELSRRAGGGRFSGDEEGAFFVWPLQIVFSNVGWYLGFECQGGKEPGLFRFERLDRLFEVRERGEVRRREEQEMSLRKLQRLLPASAGIFLGNCARTQALYLSSDRGEKSQAEMRVELWFNDSKFRFVAEGTKRFPAQQMKMSPPPACRVRDAGGQKMFSLKKTGDARFPNRFQVRLPKWCLDDVDFLRWVVGFGGGVKVRMPVELVQKVKGIGEEIVKVYQG